MEGAGEVVAKRSCHTTEATSVPGEEDRNSPKGYPRGAQTSSERKLSSKRTTIGRQRKSDFAAPEYMSGADSAPNASVRWRPGPQLPLSSPAKPTRQTNIAGQMLVNNFSANELGSKDGAHSEKDLPPLTQRPSIDAPADHGAAAVAQIDGPAERGR
jgi:hypothetical protein